jgi:hypothetical protein
MLRPHVHNLVSEESPSSLAAMAAEPMTGLAATRFSFSRWAPQVARVCPSCRKRSLVPIP